MDPHKHRYLQVFAALVTAFLAVLASVLLERVPPIAGLGLAAALGGGAVYVHWRLARLPRRLRLSAETALETIDKLMNEEE